MWCLVKHLYFKVDSIFTWMLKNKYPLEDKKCCIPEKHETAVYDT